MVGKEGKWAGEAERVAEWLSPRGRGVVVSIFEPAKVRAKPARRVISANPIEIWASPLRWHHGLLRIRIASHLSPRECTQIPSQSQTPAVIIMDHFNRHPISF